MRRVSKPVRASISFGDDAADAAEADVPEGVALVGLDDQVAIDRAGALGDHHDGGGHVAPVVGEQALGHIGHVEGFLGNQDLGGAAGDAGVGRDPAGLAAHHLDDHDAVVGLAGRAQAVDGLGGGLHGSVEAKGELGDGEVVVDGLGDADDGGALGGEPAGNGQRVVAADGDEGVDALAFERGNHSASAPPSVA